ncbi:MAG: TylF/MycF/NovP-related O-methyltransferase [Kovacikia sp.]
MTNQNSAASKDVPNIEVQGMRRSQDFEYWGQLEELLESNHHSSKHVLELFPTYIRRLHMARFLAHYELFKHAIDLPGCIVELGVGRGPSFFTWSKLLETFCTCDRSRKVFGFDHFKGLQDFHEKDGPLNPSVSKTPGGFDTSSVKTELEQLVEIHNKDNLLSGVERCRLIEGNLMETIPKFLEENPGLRISLLHLDVDLYEPTKFALEHLFPLVVKGGVVAFDEYGLIPWQGESIAAEEYFQKIGYEPVIKKFPFSGQPHGYLIK